MTKRVFIVHGWGGRPSEVWFPWIESEAKKLGAQAYALDMPDKDHPRIQDWVAHLSKSIGNPDSDTILIGHSIGCQTILRYLETISTPIRGAIFAAGFFTLTGIEQASDQDIVKPWLTTPINESTVRSNCNRIVAIFSDDDRFVPLENVKVFEKELGAETIIEHHQGHFGSTEDTKTIPHLLVELKKMMVNP